MMAGIAACQSDGVVVKGPDTVRAERDLLIKVPLMEYETFLDFQGGRVGFLSSPPIGGGRVLVCYHVYIKGSEYWTRFTSGAVDGVQKLRAKIVDDSIVIEGQLPGESAKWEEKKVISLKKALEK